jgi:DNA (cytosine-5)-methyltransferase 1
MKYGSVCSGIEAATVAWEPLGWQAQFFSEIEPFPCSLLKHHYPHVPNHGDMTKFKEWPDATLNVLVGGTPCQSFSVAGLRKGLDDPRGNLMLTFGAIAARYRPTWLVWENVPGVLSSNSGRDFGTFLGMLAELGYGFAYRVLDAQYIRVESHRRAVPQRRRRVFVVGYLGDWRRAAPVLFERESLSGNLAPGRKAGEEVAGPITAGACKSIRGTEDIENNLLVIMNKRPAELSWSTEKAFTLRATDYKDGQIIFPDVRRLLPVECERLQGFPDNYTLIPHNGKPAADGPRYKALGNSMAVNVMRFIGERIEMINTLNQGAQ